MKIKTGAAAKNTCGTDRKTILYVDPDPKYAATLYDAWSRLRLTDELRIVNSPEDALAFLASSQDRNTTDSMGAIVLDPDATGEGTGAFLREARKHCANKTVPIVFWSRDGDKYEVLKGKGVTSVLKKPEILRLIQSLDSACRLKVQKSRPFAEIHHAPVKNPD